MPLERHYGKDWDAADGTAAEWEVIQLLQALIKMLKPDLIVETGSYQGTTAYLMTVACEWNNIGRVVTCDPICLPELTAMVKQAKKYPYPFRYVQCSSLDLPELREADFVFSDSAQELRPKEYELVKPGCVFVVHDTAQSFTTDTNQHWLGDWVLSQGGLVFSAGRGFGILVKK